MNYDAINSMQSVIARFDSSIYNTRSAFLNAEMPMIAPIKYKRILPKPVNVSKNSVKVVQLPPPVKKTVQTSPGSSNFEKRKRRDWEWLKQSSKRRVMSKAAQAKLCALKKKNAKVVSQKSNNSQPSPPSQSETPAAKVQPRQKRLANVDSDLWDMLSRPAPDQSRNKNSFTIDFKISVVDWLKSNKKSISETAAYFQVDRKQVREWHKQYDSLKKWAQCGRAMNARRLKVHPAPHYPKLDEAVLKFVTSSNVRPKDQCIRSKAVHLAKEMGLSKFKASACWLNRWKRRNFSTLVNN